MTRYISLSLMFICWLLLSACAPQETGPKGPPVANAEDLRRQQVSTLIQKLESNDVQVIRVGETMRIILPSDELFNWRSANFNPKYAPHTLALLAHLMAMLETTSGEVSAYTNCLPTHALNKSLSEQQAQRVLDDLWRRGVDARLLFAVGEAFSDRVVFPGSMLDPSQNRRVEIEFRYIPPSVGRWAP